MVLKARFIKRYKGFDIMKDIGKGYFIMLSFKGDSIRIIEDEYYTHEDEAIIRIKEIIAEYGENVIKILQTRASENGENLV